MNTTAQEEHRRAEPERLQLTGLGLYHYPASPSGCYILTRDGSEIMRGTETDIWSYIHRTHPYSVEHAIRHEGYRVTPC